MTDDDNLCLGCKRVARVCGRVEAEPASVVDVFGAIAFHLHRLPNDEQRRRVLLAAVELFGIEGLG